MNPNNQPMPYIPTPEKLQALGFVAEEMKPEWPATKEGKLRYSRPTGEYCTRFLTIEPRYGGLARLGTRYHEGHPTDWAFVGILPSEAFFDQLLSAIGWTR